MSPKYEFGEGVASSRTPPSDPLQVRYAALFRQQREIVAEMRRLRLELQRGVCVICGTAFVRQRVTRVYCSQKCANAAFVARGRANGTMDVQAVRDALPLLIAGRLMTPRSIEIVQQVLALGGLNQQTVAAEEVGLSRQRVSQIMAQASKLAHTVLLMKAALIQETHTGEVTQP